MPFNLRLFWFGLSAFVVSLASGQVISIPPGNVSSSSEIGGGFNRQDDFIVNGSGLSNGRHTATVQPNMWLSTGTNFGGVDPDPFVIFDLGDVYTISAIHVWNYNESPPNLTGRGVNSVTIEYGVTAALGSVVPGITNFAEATGSSNYTGERFDSFAPFAARYIKFDINSNHGGDNQFYGLSEVQFEGLQRSLDLSSSTFLSSNGQGTLVGDLTMVPTEPGDAVSFALVSGQGADDNGRFQINGGRLELGLFDFSSSSDLEEFSVRVRASGSPSGATVERSFVITTRADTDGDLLPDWWEERWAGQGNLGAFSGLAGANGDNDGLSDLEEFQLSDQFPDLDPGKGDTDDDGLQDDDEINGAAPRPATDPTRSDTDGDSLPDGVETATGIFVGPSDTGTDPTNPDSDGDTLNDGVETGIGVFSGPGDTGSNPTLADSDGDDSNDNIEVSSGSDPNDPNSLPPVPDVGLNRRASRPDSVVVFNEIHYNPGDASGTDEWIELFNQMGIRTDISGWRVDGIGYVIPEGTFIEPGQYLVIARNPAPGELGPFPGRLSNGGERLRLINRGDRLMDELDYRDGGRWPVEPDGSGATLAKIKPYTANQPPENWTYSRESEGTRGTRNFDSGPVPVELAINELPSADSLEFWVELQNTGEGMFDLEGIVLAVDGDPTRQFVFGPGALFPGEVFLLDEATLGFRALDDEKLFLSREGVIFDARRLTGRNRGRAGGRGDQWLYPGTPTPGGPNQFVFEDGIVISEICYNPPVPLPSAENSDNQWLELANRGNNTIDLSGWRFDDGIDFEFPPGTTLDPGEHACVVRDETAFSLAYPGARILGAFGGTLSRGGERLLLVDAANNPVDEVRFFDGGRWPGSADGGGSTLELRDLDADNSQPEAWAASDEFDQTSWQTYTYRKTAVSGGPTLWREFNMGLLDSGEVLIDDLSVIEDPDGSAIQMLSNGDFESGTATWRLRGNHRESEVIPDPDNPGNQVLRLVASGVTEHMHNQIETTLANNESVVNGREYEISFRARWVTGTSLFLTRLYLARSANANVIARPVNVGTPSTINSRAESNMGPTFDGMKHSPAVPNAGQPITVSLQAEDPDVITGMTLRFSVNGGAFQSTFMSGVGGGRFEGTIPGQIASAVVQFYVEGVDGLGGVSQFPAGGPDSRALIKVNDGLASNTGIHNFRIIMTNADRDLMHTNIEVMSNARFDATVIDREEEIYYGARVRLKGSQRARAYQPRVGYNLRFGPDQPYRGVHQSMAIDRSEGTGSGQFELLFDLMMANSDGVISRYYDLIQVITPTGITHTRPAVLQMARYDDVFLDSQFEDGADGNLFEYDFVYFPQNTDGNGNKIPQGDGISGIQIQDNGNDQERYRFYLSKKNNRDNDNFEPIITYCKQMSKSGAAFDATLEEVVDVDSWLRGMAYAVLSGAGDNTAAGTGHNGMYYARPDGRIVYLPHDMDFAFSNTRSIYANGEVNRMTNSSSTPGNEARRRIYFGHLHDIITTTWNDDYMGPWKSHLSVLSPSQNWNSPNSGSYSISGRSNYVLGQINGRIPEVPFSITTPSPLVVNNSTATVSGRGWINVREIRLLGAPEALDVVWIDEDTWQVSFPVRPGAQSYQLQAFDFSGDLIESQSLTIENTTVVQPASMANLVISELMYHPADPDAGEFAAGFDDADLFEFVELMNIGSEAIDLTGVSFMAGINYDLPAILMAPGERKVLARNRAAFLARYPGREGDLFDGEYLVPVDQNQFSNGGERVMLVDAFGFPIRDFVYADDFPWPNESDGDGFSMTLIAPTTNPDHQLPQSWRRSLALGGSPGNSDELAFSGVPNDDDDQDGLEALLEFAMGTSDQEFTQSHNVTFDSFGNLVFAYNRQLGTDGVELIGEISSDLHNWTPISESFVLVSETGNGDGLRTLEWRTVSPPEGQQVFLRLRAVAR